MKVIFLLLVFLSSTAAFAQSKVAMVKLLRGEANVLSLGKTVKLKVDDWVESGSVIKTQEKSFVKLVFIDKSQMNVGPNSEMKIESFSGKDSGVIDLVKGKIRSQVTKDYLQMKDKDKSKLFIKTQNAVMGVRGTDFIISTNGKNTSTVLFEGSIVFNKLENHNESSSGNLESIVDKGVNMFPGEFSVMEVDKPMPTVPSLLSVQQKEALEKNTNFEADRSPSNTEKVEAKSVVPGGLNGQVVSNSSDVLKTEVAAVAKESENKSPASKDAEGYVKGDLIKPANGSFVHIDSGVIIPPGPGSVLDSNTNTYIAGSKSGTIGTDGNYVPPKNVEITYDGKVLIAVTDANGVTVVQEIEPPQPVLTTTSIAIGDVGGILTTNPTLISTTTVVTNDILNTQFTPSGLTDLSNQKLNQTGGITGVTDPTISGTKANTTIIVTPP